MRKETHREKKTLAHPSNSAPQGLKGEYPPGQREEKQNHLKKGCSSDSANFIQVKKKNPPVCKGRKRVVLAGTAAEVTVGHLWVAT